MSEQNNIDSEIIEDLKNDLTNNNKIESGKIEGVENVASAELVPSFLPLPLVRYSVVGKNSIVVLYLAKNIPTSSHKLLQDHYKPTDNEVDLYKKFLENIIWKYFPAVARWFMQNDAMTIAGEVILFETVRLMPMLSLFKNEEKKDVPHGTGEEEK